MVKKIDTRIILRIMAVIIGVIIPAILLTISASVLRKYKREKEEVFEEKVEVKERLAPSQVLNNKSKYNQSRIVISGRVSPGPVVCERKECPVDDPCCGCPSERDLIIYDPGVVLSPKAEGRLRLLAPQGGSFCRRRVLSCDYDCGDWTEGAIYDVGGVFFAEPPPPGWKLSLEYYFQVESKELVKKVGPKEFIGNLFEEIKNLVEKFKKSGYYILP